MGGDRVVYLPDNAVNLSRYAYPDNYSTFDELIEEITAEFGPPVKYFREVDNYDTWLLDDFKTIGLEKPEE